MPAINGYQHSCQPEKFLQSLENLFALNIEFQPDIYSLHGFKGVGYSRWALMIRYFIFKNIKNTNETNPTIFKIIKIQSEIYKLLTCLNVFILTMYKSA